MHIGLAGRRSLVAATAAKPVPRPPLHLVFGSKGIPHPDKADKGGEDAFFHDDSYGTFGVADGVGGSASEGVDPGLFSREIMRRCHAALSQPHDSLSHALQTAAATDLTLGGSSTCLIGRLEAPSNVLRVVNLGDSGLMLLRPAMRRFTKGNFAWPRIVMRTAEQTHAFNTPYQTDANDFDAVASSCDELTAVAKEGDVLIAATDGVLDNLFDSQIQNVVARSLADLRTTSKGSEGVQLAVDALADLIAQEAHAMGLREDDETVKTPFEIAAAKDGYRFAGGKLDDVAVVVGLVRSGEPPPRRGIQSNFGE